MTAKVERYQAGLFQSVELTEDIPWEPYSPKFAETEEEARAASSVTALRVAVPCRMDSSKDGEEVYPQRSPILMEWCVAVASRLVQSHVLIELLVDEDLASRLVAAVNIESDMRNRGRSRWEIG